MALAPLVFIAGGIGRIRKGCRRRSHQTRQLLAAVPVVVDAVALVAVLAVDRFAVRLAGLPAEELARPLPRTL